MIHGPGQGWRWWNKTLIHWLHHPERHYSCTGLLLCVTDVCLSVMLWLSIFTHLTLGDSSCIFITKPDLIFKTLVRHTQLMYNCHTNSWQWRPRRDVTDSEDKEVKRKRYFQWAGMWVNACAKCFFHDLSSFYCLVNACCSDNVCWPVCICLLFHVFKVYLLAYTHKHVQSYSYMYLYEPFNLDISPLLQDSRSDGKVRATGCRVIRWTPKREVSVQRAT